MDFEIEIIQFDRRNSLNNAIKSVQKVENELKITFVTQVEKRHRLA